MNANKICVQWFEESCSHNPVLLSPLITYLQICNKCSTTCSSCGTGSVYLSGAHAFNSCFLWRYCCLVFSFLCNILWIIVCVLVLLFWPCIVRFFLSFYFGLVLSVFRQITSSDYPLYLVWLFVFLLILVVYYWPSLIKCSLKKHAIQCTMIYSSREEVREQ